MPAFLLILNGKKAGTKYELKPEVVKIGRLPDCDISLDSNSVSRTHARIARGPNGHVIADLESRNGTFVNDLRIDQPHQLQNKDRIKVGETLFRYQTEPDPRDIGKSTDEITFPDDDRPSTILSSIDAQGSSVFLSRVRPEAKLLAIFEISQAIAQTLDLGSIFGKILETAFKIFPQADRGLVIDVEPSGRFIPRAFRHRRKDDDDLRFSRTLVRQAIDEKKGVLSADAGADSRFSMSESIADFRLRSVMCAPLMGMDQKALGVIQLDTTKYDRQFSEEDLQVLMSMANQAAIAMENARLHEQTLQQERMQRELEFAREVQQGFLPRRLPQVEGYDFWAYYCAAGEVGGDYYDFLPLPNGQHAALVADVSGHGVPAALLMARFTGDVKVTLVANPDDLPGAVSKLNSLLCEAELDDRFVTMTAMVLDPPSGHLRIVCAGHMSPIIRRRDGHSEEPANLTGGAIPLGILMSADYSVVESDLSSGEVAVVYSDGISEAMNAGDEQYTSARLKEIIQSSRGGARETGEAILANVREFCSGRTPHDDMTIIVISRK